MPTILQIDKKDTPFVYGGLIASGVTLAEANLVGINSNGEIVLATNVSGASQAKARGFVETGNTVGDTLGGTRPLRRIAFYERGKLGGFSGLTINGDVYLATAGGYTQTKPTAIGTINQVIGYAISATEIIVDIRPQGITTN